MVRAHSYEGSKSVSRVTLWLVHDGMLTVLRKQFTFKVIVLSVLC